MLFGPKTKKKLEKTLIDKHKFVLDKQTSNLKREVENLTQRVRFFRWFTDITILYDFYIEEDINRLETVLNKWAPQLDNRLSFAFIYDDRIEFEFKEDINSINADYIVYLVDKITEKLKTLPEIKSE